jgi:hypothetical protein
VVLLLCATVLLLCARFEEASPATSDRSMRAFSALASPSRALELTLEFTSDFARLRIASTSLTLANLLLLSGEGKPRREPASSLTSTAAVTRGREEEAHRAPSRRNRWEMVLEKTYA